MIKNNSMSLLRAQLHNFNYDRRGNNALSGSKRIYRFPFTFTMPTSQTNLSRHSFSQMSSTVSLDFYRDYGEEVPPLDICANYRMDISLTNFVLQLLHEAATSFFLAIKSQKSSTSHLKVANAWVGVDVDVWHQQIAYQAAVYALLKTVMKMENMFDDKHLVFSILSPKVSLIIECIESQLNKREQNLVTWFRTEQLSILTKYFTPLMERWASEYGKSCIAVTVLATSCCVALTKLGAKRISCPAFTKSLPDLTRELMDALHGSSSIGKLHCLATNAGFENEFLSHFGPKVLHCDTRGEIMFWMRLLEVKLVAAFDRESVITNLRSFCDTQVLARDLAVLGLFAFLGRKTRLFLSHLYIKDLDEPVKDFICYLECGILFLYPELSSMCMYQLFMEVVSEELGWLDFYPALPCMRHQERKRSKQHALQAEKEIILSTVFGICSDMFSSFSHYSKETQASLDAKLVLYLQRSKNLLVICIEDYWAAYDRLCGLGKATRVQFPEPMTHLWDIGTIRMRHRCCGDPMTREITESNPPYASGINKVTAIGHAAILTAIKRYIPRLIPSPYSKERLDIIKQIKRAKKMKAQSWSQPNVSSVSSM
ncbi:uncharacterized protein [Elaeis guineensis]|uniref:uncharacterized protein isoform X2 n=1 Tax=Elaeis guineensis var. tenera TaxID=51953 RepID=UPI003C6D2473